MKKRHQPIVKRVKWDRKSTIGLIVALCTIILIFMILAIIPQYVRNYKASKFDSKTFGIVLLIQPNKTPYQDFEGAKMVTPNYTVYFSYTVDGQSYDNSNTIPNQGIYQAFVDEVYKSNYEKKVIVKYKRNNPKESLIIVEK